MGFKEKLWTEEEFNYIINNFKLKTVSEMATELRRTEKSVTHKLVFLRGKGIIPYFSREEKTVYRLEEKFKMPVKELLYKRHWDEEKSVLVMSKEFGITRKCITDLMTSLDVPHRDCSESLNLRYKYMGADERKAITKDANEFLRSRGYTPRPHMCGENHPLWKGGLQKYTCDHCKKEFERPPSHVKAEGITACSRECAYLELSTKFRGENNPAWKGGKKSWRGTDWKEVSSAVRERDHYVCQLCGMTDDECKINYGNRLQVHHINPYRLTKDNNPEFLVTLCNKCHMWAEHNPK